MAMVQAWASPLAATSHTIMALTNTIVPYPNLECLAFLYVPSGSTYSYIKPEYNLFTELILWQSLHVLFLQQTLKLLQMEHSCNFVWSLWFSIFRSHFLLEIFILYIIMYYAFVSFVLKYSLRTSHKDCTCEFFIRRLVLGTLTWSIFRNPLSIME